MSSLFINGKFDLFTWKEIVQKAGVKTLGDYCQSITPFGFEVTEDVSYLYKNLNRFYCYISSSELPTHSLELEKKFVDELLNQLKMKDFDFYKRISVIVYEHDKICVDMLKEFSENSILINIEQRICDNLLIDYAQYLSCCLFEIENNTSQEFNRFNENLNVRNRCYQLYLIIEYATQYLNIQFSDEERNVFSSLHTLNKSKISHYYTSKKHIVSTDKEKEVYNIIKNRLHKIYLEVVSDKKKSKHIKIKSYNSDNIIEQNVPLSYYNHFVDYISVTYSEFR